MLGIEKNDDSTNFLNKFQGVVDQILRESECLSGRALAALFFELFSKTVGIREPPHNAVLSLEYLASDNFFRKIDNKKMVFGIFLHSFTLQFFAVSLQLETMCQNCMKWLEGEEFLKVPIGSINDLFDHFPCMNPDTPAIECITLLDDLKDIWNMYAPEKQYFDRYRDLIHLALSDDASARLPLLEMQIMFDMSLQPDFKRGIFMNRFARAAFSYQLKLRLWLIDFMEKTDDPTYFSSFKKRKRLQQIDMGGEKSLREIVSEVLAKSDVEQK